MTTLSAPPVTRPPAQSGHPTGSQDGSTARRVLSGYFRLLSVPLAGALCLAAGWTLLPATGWATAAGAMAVWSSAVLAWLHRRRWRAAPAHLAAWAAPAALLAPMAALGALSPSGLALWGPVSTLLAIALVAASDPDLLGTRSGRHRGR
jgi:hypothetical protein